MCTNALPSVLVHMRTISLRTPGGAVRTRWVVENQDGRGDFMFIGKGVEGCGKGGRAWREKVSRKTSHRMTAFNQSLGSGGHVS